MIKTVKDPDSIEDFMFDWSARASTDGVAGSEWTVPAGVSVLAHSHNRTQTTVRLAGGASGQVYRVTNRVTLDSGQVLDASILVRCQEQ